MPKIILSKTGRRIYLCGQKPEELARKLEISTGSVLNLLAGKNVKEYQLEERQREREPMSVKYSLTRKGEEYIHTSQSGLARLLSNVSRDDEASVISKKMLSLGLEKYTRLRVLQDMNGAAKRGLVVARKESGAIY